MHISRVFLKNFRNFSAIDISLSDGVTCLVGENNTGKSNLIFALRLALDTELSSTYRILTDQDFHTGIDSTSPTQVIVSIEFSDFADNESSEALVGMWETPPNSGTARITYRFTPDSNIIQRRENGEDLSGKLTLDDYHWEIRGGGVTDPVNIEWYQLEGRTIPFSDLQQYHVVFLRPLRDVGQDLREARSSPLNRLLDSSGISDDEKAALVEILRDANTAISGRPPIAAAGAAIDTVYKQTAGDAFDIDVRLGMSDPSFTSITRSLKLLLSNEAIQDFEPFRNGLGLNNVLYISMLMEAFQRRANSAKFAGQLLLIEEPEAHLHPQLQKVLFSGLQAKAFQTIVSTHSTHITSSCPLPSVVLLTNQGSPATSVGSPGMNNSLDGNEIGDLERYLDATRSTILFARKVILVEGPSEQFLLPPMIKCVMGIDLERHGVTVVPIHGIHFNLYAKLFNYMGMPKKCAIIADGDLAPSDIGDSDEDFPLPVPDLDAQRSEFVRDFRCQSTFERALTIEGTLGMLASGIEELGAVNVADDIRHGFEMLQDPELADEAKSREIARLKERVLRTANRYGKARFAQVVSKHACEAVDLPAYVREAIDWLDL